MILGDNIAARIVSDQQLEIIEKRQKAGEALVNLAPEYGVTYGALRTRLHRWRHRNDAPAIMSLNRHRCIRCKHSWLPRIEARPVECPKCKSRNWDVPCAAQKGKVK